MTTEIKNAMNDPNSAIQIAIGDPAPKLVPQRRSEGIEKDAVYYDEPKRYVLKKAHLAMDDIRIFDTDGNLVANSHHPGKNPYDAFDPLGVANTDAAFNVAGGEWESLCDVSGHSGGIQSFKVRPKTFTRHGRQWIKGMDDGVVMSVGKISKLKSKSLRSSFEVCRGDSRDRVYKAVTDLVGRTFQFYDHEDELIAVMAKTKKALILTAAFGSGSESTIDIAPGVDCSVIIAAVFGIIQVGSSVVGDFVSNFFVNPVQDYAVGEAVDGAFGGGDEEGGFDLGDVLGGGEEDEEDEEGGGLGGLFSGLVELAGALGEE